MATVHIVPLDPTRLPGVEEVQAVFADCINLPGAEIHVLTKADVLGVDLDLTDSFDSDYEALPGVACVRLVEVITDPSTRSKAPTEEQRQEGQALFGATGTRVLIYDL